MSRNSKSSKKIQRTYERPDEQPIAITPVEYTGLQTAYDHFNVELFDRTLGDVFITYQRRAHSAGYFSPNRFSGRIGQFGKHELALNPDGFINQTDEQICQTLVHEMAHVWQHQHGKPSSRGYHNAEWALKMESKDLLAAPGDGPLEAIPPDGELVEALNAEGLYPHIHRCEIGRDREDELIHSMFCRVPRSCLAAPRRSTLVPGPSNLVGAES